jgi:SAM-dependent methyltransferase
MSPVSRIGWQRGTPIDRRYIESFLQEHRHDIHGDVLEVKDSGYTTQFGERVSRSEVLDINGSNPQATIVADLTSADVIADSSFDCVILTQVLQYIYEPERALAHTARILRTGGTVLATLPAVMRKDDHAVDYWRFTEAGSKRLFEGCFGPGNVEVVCRGNLVASIAFLNGMAGEELRESELEYHDASYPVTLCVRAVKPG